MSDHNLAEAVRRAINTADAFNAAQARLHIESGVNSILIDPRVATEFEASYKANMELREALAAHEAEQQAGEAVAWLVVDAAGQLMHAAGWEAAAHEHINDALNEYGIEEAAKWRVIPVFTHPQQPLTDEQIEKGREATFSTSNPFCPCDSKTMRKAVRWAERAHGIGITKDAK